MTDRLAELSAAGVSIWLDDLTRERLRSGSLAALIEGSHVVGVTTNPTIFDGALTAGSAAYAQQVAQLSAAGASVATAVRTITTDDVRSACELFGPVYDATAGTDGRVSIEVDPRLARDTAGTVAEARELHATVGRPQVLIKIPATVEGLPAITEVIGAGISVNVTLIFGVSRYRAVMDAWMSGLEKAAAAGIDLATIESVASFFVSRVDTEADKRLPADSPLRGTAAIANARLAYAAYEDTMAGERWAALAAQGARPQRPLWASTGVKDPAYADTRYVTELVGRGVVNTMPEKTLDAVRDHGQVTGDTLTGEYLDDARGVWSALADAGVDMDDVERVLEDEGVAKFVDSWEQLLGTVEKALAQGGTGTAA